MSIRIVLLCEDKQTDTFIRRFLSHRNFGIRDIHSCEYLGGREVDETKAYPRLGRERDCKPLADRLHETCHRKQRLDDSAPLSLRDACRDYPKLKR